ncbi:MAG: hypothetical protein ACLFUB_02395 [Cyclobacteriaceae bacterium]
MKRLQIFLYWLTLSISIYTSAAIAQELPIGAEAAGMGHAAINLKGRAGVFANPAGLAYTRSAEILAGVENRFGLGEGLLGLNAAYLHRLSKATLGLSVYRFGDEFFSTHQLGLNFSQQINQFCFGLRLRQHQYSGEGIDTHFATAIDVGGIFLISRQLNAGMLIRNINQGSYSHGFQDQLPTSLEAGLSFLPDERLSLHSSLFYELDERPMLRLGVDYHPLQKLHFRSGFNTGVYPLYFFGLGLSHTLLQFDYAIEWHNMLGLSHQLGLVYKLPQHEK